MELIYYSPLFSFSNLSDSFKASITSSLQESITESLILVLEALEAKCFWQCFLYFSLFFLE